MEIVIIEDELYNLRLLQGMIKKIRPDWKVVRSFESVKKSVTWFLENKHPDLVFMDIQLADGICFSIFQQVEIKSMVIFTTAFDNYAIQAFKVNSIDYLLKPIKENELEAAICKFESFSNTLPDKQEVDFNKIINAIKTGDKNIRKRILVSGSTTYFKLNVEEIAYFYSENRVVTAVTFKNKKHIIDFTLENLDEELNSEIFFRANRQIIVNIDAVKKIEDYFGGKLKCKLDPDFNDDIVISRLKASIFKQWMGN